MENIRFNNACLEVLEILRHVKKEDLLKIPKEEIQMLRKNANYNHKFIYNPEKNIKEQEVSKLAKGIIAVYFYKYTASEQQREKIKLKQKSDLNKIEQEKKELYKNEDIFKHKTEIKSENEDKNTQLIEYKKEKWYTKLFNKIKKFFMR